MPTLRDSPRRGPEAPSPAVRTCRSETRAHRLWTSQSGMPHRSKTSRSQWRPTRSKARGWSANRMARH
eukprot:14139012-Alexandrium_andersonii.AAC.1